MACQPSRVGRGLGCGWRWFLVAAGSGFGNYRRRKVFLFFDFGVLVPRGVLRRPLGFVGAREGGAGRRGVPWACWERLWASCRVRLASGIQGGWGARFWAPLEVFGIAWRPAASVAGVTLTCFLPAFAVAVVIPAFSSQLAWLPVTLWRISSQLLRLLVKLWLVSSQLSRLLVKLRLFPRSFRGCQ